MRVAKGDKKQRRLRAVKALAESEPELTAARLVLPAAKVRRLVLQIILVEGVAPFVRRMVAVIDGLRAGHTLPLTRLARQSGNQPLAELLAPISRAARRGQVAEADETAFYAASYAYRNSLDYLLGLLSYLDGFRRMRARRSRRESHTTAPRSRRR
jgi:hypothetical protein